MSASFDDYPPEVFDITCRDCPRLANFLDEVRARNPEYFCKPVPPFGDPDASFLVVGLAPGMHGANASGRPFTGDFAGILLYETLHRHGFATRPVSESAGDGLQLPNCRITNAVKCLPPQNKPVGAEISQCNHYLAAELGLLAPGSVVMALGKIAHDAVLKAQGLKMNAAKFAHAAEHAMTGFTLLDSYHCSRYNTQTKRLTPGMFDAVIARARELIGSKDR